MPATDRRYVVTLIDWGMPDLASLLRVSGRAVPRHGGADLPIRPAPPEIAR